MRIAAFAALAVSAAAFAPATAQTVQDPDPYYGVPPPPPGAMPPPNRPGPPPGVTWQGSQGQVHMDGSMARQDGAMPPRRMMQMHPGMQGQTRHIQRGGRVPPAWANQRFEVRDWRRFGFPAPFAGGRWIRYNDDALLIDGDGLVYDSRPDWRWDGAVEERGQEAREERGYEARGSGEEMGRGWEGREREWGGRAERQENVRTRVYVEHGAPPPPGYGGYGYGYGPVMVTETTVTEPAVVEQRTYVRTYVERVRIVHRRHRIHRCGCRVAPAPVLGERG
jgi:Ni/Co efflux regulator RcnB